MSVLISCEVGGNRIPAEIAAMARATGDALPKQTACGDETAKYLAERMSSRLYAPLIANEDSSQLIDVTHSLHHRQLFPKRTRGWTAENRQWLIDQIHTPYRERVREGIRQMFRHFPYVIHLSIRSFPLKQGGKIRRADAGLLYDPGQDDEVDLCLDWIDEMYELIPMLRVRRNYPRRGTTDSLTKSMRSEFADRNYLGIEVLVNQAWCGRVSPIREEVIDGMCDTLKTLTTQAKSDAA